MTATTSAATAPRPALERLREAEHLVLDLPIMGRISIPPPEQLAYLGGIGTLVALELLEWPVAVALTAGHLLAEAHHHRLLQGIGEALEEA
ncbi:hypothetical protein [Rhodococcus aetherivorans]|uniref:hypothetical protein n=1 Tax=Rhodococcus aetherivorans TaxID=191292 RepID=UPI00045D382E|nr:hypothetical protein [Rhodococcus aetherivorans]KDE10379.1 hypothetical protein N505_0125830 [Rhodococcus aetherivorans]